MSNELEKEIYDGQGFSEKEILCSIAISLKRIADKLELSQKQPILMTAEEAIKYNATSVNSTYKD